MQILLLTNLYPPQELGGYGRSMADFAWGLKKLGNQIEVICSDAPYLSINSKEKESDINRILILKGSFENGVTNIQDINKRAEIDIYNIKMIKSILSKRKWDGILIGNIDLIGVEILPILIKSKIPILHHIGFIEPSFRAEEIPKSKNYIMVSASYAVRQSLIEKGFITPNHPVIYPGARTELFGENVTKRKLPKSPDGTEKNPLCIAFAGLLMSSKGLHTLVESIIKLKQKGVSTRTFIAGDDFQKGYKEALKSMLNEHNLQDSVLFTGSLSREKLSRFFCLNHVFVFPSIYPEAFGIVQAEAMASKLAILSTGVGGSKEMIQDGFNGFLFQSQNSNDLSKKLLNLIEKPELIKQFGINSQKKVITNFSTIESAKKLESIFLKMSN